MEQSIKKFLEFNGKNIYFTAVNGEYYVAIRPICEALGVNYEQQLKNIKQDEELSEVSCMQKVIANDGKLREVVCLPEFYVYGWIFTINSTSPELKQYKWACNRILFGYFNGGIKERNSQLKAKTQLEIEIEKLEALQKQTEYYKKIQELKSQKTNCDKELKRLDSEIITNQLPLWGFKNEVENTQ